jgi:ATP-dependent DNA helicase RecQ
MQNSYQQAHNLANAFVVQQSKVRPGPVLLLDDTTDSGWTFTIVAALLREAGSGPVFPVALSITAKTGTG